MTYLDPYTHLRLHDADTERRFVNAALVREARFGGDEGPATSERVGPIDAGGRLVRFVARRISLVAHPQPTERQAGV